MVHLNIANFIACASQYEQGVLCCMLKPWSAGFVVVAAAATVVVCACVGWLWGGFFGRGEEAPALQMG